MANPLNFGRDLNSYNAYAPQLASVKYNATITNGNETNITIAPAIKIFNDTLSKDLEEIIMNI